MINNLKYPTRTDKQFDWAWLFPHHVRYRLFRYLRRSKFDATQALRKPNNQALNPIDCFDRHQCIFIHIPKCAGNSISKSLFATSTTHRTALDYQLIYSPKEYKVRFKFTFVRNPWDRLVSAYYFLKGGGLNQQDMAWSNQHLSKFNTFDSFVCQWVNKNNVRTGWVHFRPQYLFICNALTKSSQIDFIGRYESLNRDFQYVARRLSIPAELVHLNAARAIRPAYHTFYTPKTWQIVAKAYSEDIQLFGYGNEDSLDQ